jgi:Ca-activated chloride channel family protein
MSAIPGRRTDVTVLHWAEPWWWLLWGPVALVLLGPRRPRPTIYFSATALFDVPAAVSLRQHLVWLPFALRLASCTLLVAALARPQTPEADSAVHEPGLSVMICVDTSGSMGAVDAAGPSGAITRLDQVKAFLGRFLAGREDLVGVIAFAASPRVVCPPTTDHGALRLLAERLEVDRLDNRTNIGDAIALAIDQLQETPVAERLILLATDGAHNVSTAIGVGEAARIAEALSIRIHTIGIGPDSGGGNAISEQDEAALRAVADWTRGRYFRAANLEEVEQLSAEMANVVAAPVRLLGYQRRRDWIAELTVAALVLLALERLLSATWLRVLPE